MSGTITGWKRSPWLLKRSTTCAAFFSERTVPWTVNPSSRRARAIHAPLKPETPVTRTVAGGCTAGILERHSTLYGIVWIECTRVRRSLFSPNRCSYTEGGALLRAHLKLPSYPQGSVLISTLASCEMGSWRAPIYPIIYQANEHRNSQYKISDKPHS